MGMVQRLCGRKGGCRCLESARSDLHPGHTPEELEKKLLKTTIPLKSPILLGWRIEKQSIDARKKPDLCSFPIRWMPR